MKRIFEAVVLTAIFPAVSRATVTLRPELESFPGGPGDGVVMLDVYASNPNASENEQLNAFVIALEAPGFSPTGVRFVNPPADPRTATITFPRSSASHPYVFASYPGNEPVDPIMMSDYNTVLITAALGGTGQKVDISDSLNGFARLAVLVPADTPPANYFIYVNPDFYMLGGAGTPFQTSLGFGGLILPEPGALGLLLVGATMALRRRRAG